MHKKHIFLNVFQKIMLFACVFCAFFISPVFATLPAGYTQLEYIEGGYLSNTYIDLGYGAILGMKTVLEASLQDVQNGSNDRSGQQILLGVSDGAAFLTGNTYAIDVNPQTVAFANGKFFSGTNNVYLSLQDDLRYVFNINYPQDNVIAVNNSVKTVDAATKVANGNLILFGWNVNGSYMRQFSVGTMRMYRLRQWDDNSILIHDWLPAKNLSGDVGIYDVVNKIFKTSATTNNFIAGPVAEIKIATTKMVDEEFAAAEAQLAATVQTIESVVSRTIAQTGQIATLQEEKQTRPDENCPANMKCLLVQDEDGTPHWYPIIEP